MGSMEVPGKRAAEGGGPYGFVYRSISGSGKRRTGLSTTTKTPAKATPRAEDMRKKRRHALRVPRLSSPRRGVTSFSLLDRARPVFSFSSGRKRENGGCIAPAIAGIQSSPPEGRVQSPLWGPAKRDSPFRAVSFFCRKAKSHFTHLTTRRVRPKRPIALGITIRLLNISDSSHTRSLDARVPRKINTRAISV